MKLAFLGGAYEVGASCILLIIDHKNILLDCGIRQSTSKDPLPDLRLIQDMGGIDAIIISHAHLDHTGCLPIVSKEYPEAKIYATKMTKELIKVLLYDSIKIMNNHEAEIPLYAEQDVENMLNKVYPMSYEAGIHIIDGIKLTFYNAGHIAGAACAYIEGSEGAFFYSGDFSIFSQRTVEGAKLPKLRPDAAIFESTYGDRLHSNREAEEDKLIELAEECARKKGKMLIPAFALGRAQEVLLVLKKAMNKKKLRGIDIYVDGMVRNINNVYEFNPLFLKGSLGKKILKGGKPFYDDHIKPIETREQREKILEGSESCIIVSSSGMLTGGPSQYYAEKIVGMENGYIVITGYQDEEAPGRKLIDLLEQEPQDRVIEINNKKLSVRCRVDQIGLSAHSDKGEIKALIEHICHKNIFLVHGEEKSISALSKDLAGEVRGRIYTPKCGEVIDIYIKNKREQWKKQIPSVMHKKEMIEAENIPDLWRFIYESYGDRLFTTEEINFIWSGTRKIKASEAERVQKLILSSPYFETDPRRLFLFKTKSQEEVSEALKPGDLKQNELNDMVYEYFSEYGYKKASIMLNEKRIRLNFDFPDAVEKSINEKIAEFQDKTSWKIDINENANINAASEIIKKLIGEDNIKKVSFYGGKNAVTVFVNAHTACPDIAEKFKEKTGLDIALLEEKEINMKSQEDFYVSGSVEKLEQNEALAIIDAAFREEEFKPYKKGIKNNEEGKYIELAFISPSVGRRYGKKIEDISNKIGWNISISGAVNQNEVIRLAAEIMKEKGIILKKNPSYNPSDNSVTVKLQVNAEEAFEEIKQVFKNKTGCSLII